MAFDPSSISNHPVNSLLENIREAIRTIPADQSLDASTMLTLNRIKAVSDALRDNLAHSDPFLVSLQYIENLCPSLQNLYARLENFKTTKNSAPLDEANRIADANVLLSTPFLSNVPAIGGQPRKMDSLVEYHSSVASALEKTKSYVKELGESVKGFDVSFDEIREKLDNAKN